MSSQDVVTIGTLLNVVGLCFLVGAQLIAFRDRDQRERASGERPQPLGVAGRSRVLMVVAMACVGVAAVLLVSGFITQ